MRMVERCSPGPRFGLPRSGGLGFGADRPRTAGLCPLPPPSARSLAAASVSALLAVAIVGPAGGAPKSMKDKRLRDRVAPTAPANPHVVKVTPDLVYVAWDPSTDNVGVAGYVVSGDGRPAIATSPSFVVSTLGCGQSTPFSVVAFDRAGNRSSRVTTTVSTAACPDTQPPTSPSGLHAGRDDRERGRAQLDAVDRQRRRRELRRVPQPRPRRHDAVAHGDADGAELRKHLRLHVRRRRRLGEPVGSLVRVRPDRSLQRRDAAERLRRISSVTGRTPSSLALAWSASSDDVGVAGYHVSVNGAPTLTLTQTDREPAEPLLRQDLQLRSRRLRRRREPLAGDHRLRHDGGLRRDAPVHGHDAALDADRARDSNVTQTGLTLALEARRPTTSASPATTCTATARRSARGSSTVGDADRASCGTSYTLRRRRARRRRERVAACTDAVPPPQPARLRRRRPTRLRRPRPPGSPPRT